MKNQSPFMYNDKQTLYVDHLELFSEFKKFEYQ